MSVCFSAKRPVGRLRKGTSEPNNSGKKGPELPALQNWKELSNRLRERFAPTADAYSLSQEFQSATQNPGETVAAYAARLQRLAAKWNEARGPTTAADR